MRTWKKVTFLAAALSVAAPSIAKDRLYNPPSGRPEGVFPGMTVDEVGGKIAATCMDGGLLVANQSTNQVVCEANMNMGESVLTQALIGNSYSTQPRKFVRVSLAQVGGDVRAQVSGWVETTMAFGQVRNAPLTSSKAHDEMMGLLLASGAKLPNGTASPNRPYLGVMFSGVQKVTVADGSSVTGATVYKTVEFGPADVAGLKPGDYITAVNGRRIKSADDVSKLLSHVKVGSAYTLEYVRDGATQNLAMTAIARP